LNIIKGGIAGGNIELQITCEYKYDGQRAQFHFPFRKKGKMEGVWL
jgi:hypothetical protein